MILFVARQVLFVLKNQRFPLELWEYILKFVKGSEKALKYIGRYGIS